MVHDVALMEVAGQSQPKGIGDSHNRESLDVGDLVAGQSQPKGIGDSIGGRQLRGVQASRRTITAERHWRQ